MSGDDRPYTDAYRWHPGGARVVPMTHEDRLLERLDAVIAGLQRIAEALETRP